MMKIEDLKSIDPKDKVIVVHGDDLDSDEIHQLFDQLKKVGALGVIQLPKDTEVSTLGEKELQQILDHIRKNKR